MAARSTTAGTPVKSWQQHARRREGDLALRGAGGLPGEQRLDVLARDPPAVLAAQQVLEQ